MLREHPTHPSSNMVWHFLPKNSFFNRKKPPKNQTQNTNGYWIMQMWSCHWPATSVILPRPHTNILQFKPSASNDSISIHAHRIQIEADFHTANCSLKLITQKSNEDTWGYALSTSAKKLIHIVSQTMTAKLYVKWQRKPSHKCNAFFITANVVLLRSSCSTSDNNKTSVDYFTIVMD